MKLSRRGLLRALGLSTLVSPLAGMAPVGAEKAVEPISEPKGPVYYRDLKKVWEDNPGVGVKESFDLARKQYGVAPACDPFATMYRAKWTAEHPVLYGTSVAGVKSGFDVHRQTVRLDGKEYPLTAFESEDFEYCVFPDSDNV